MLGAWCTMPCVNSYRFFVIPTKIRGTKKLKSHRIITYGNCGSNSVFKKERETRATWFFPASTTLWMKVSSHGEFPVSISYPSAISSTARIMNYAPPNSTMHSKSLTKLPTSTNFHATHSASHWQKSSPFELYSFWYLAFASPSPRPFSSWRSAKTPLMIGRKVAAFALYAMPRLVESATCFSFQESATVMSLYF